MGEFVPVPRALPGLHGHGLPEFAGGKRRQDLAREAVRQAYPIGSVFLSGHLFSDLLFQGRTKIDFEEMRYARNELGMRAGFLRPNPYNGRMLHHPDYAPFWAEVQELDFASGLHEGAGLT
jgi:hypothetical protein